MVQKDFVSKVINSAVPVPESTISSCLLQILIKIPPKRMCVNSLFKRLFWTSIEYRKENNDMSIWSQRVGHDWSDLAHTHRSLYMLWKQFAVIENGKIYPFRWGNWVAWETMCLQVVKQQEWEPYGVYTVVTVGSKGPRVGAFLARMVGMEWRSS